MRAFIREDKWNEFKEVMGKYKFGIDLKKPKTYYTKIIDDDMLLIVSRKTREMNLITPMGCSPFMEVHTNFYKDLFDDGFVEYLEGKFD